MIATRQSSWTRVTLPAKVSQLTNVVAARKAKVAFSSSPRGNTKALILDVDAGIAHPRCPQTNDQPVSGIHGLDVIHFIANDQNPVLFKVPIFQGRKPRTMQSSLPSKNVK